MGPDPRHDVTPPTDAEATADIDLRPRARRTAAPTVDDGADGLAGPAAGDRATDGDGDLDGSAAPPDGAAGDDLGERRWWQLVRRYEASGRRFLPGLWFPVVVFTVWRLAHLGAVWVAMRGDVAGEGAGATVERVGDAAYAYDGERYLQVLHYGYSNWRLEMPNTAFFPLTSWLGRPIHWLTGSNAITVHLLMTLTGLAAFVAVWGVSRAWKDDRVGRRAVVLLALFPSSLFLWAFYSEGLFIALAAGGVWADRRDRRGIAAALFLALAMTRSIGILVPAVIVVLRLVRERRIDRWALTYAAAGAAGLGIVMWNMWDWTGAPHTYTKVQGDWGRDLSAPWTSIAQGIDILYPADDADEIMIPALVARNWDVWCIGIVAVALGYAGLSRKDRWPAETWMIGVALIALPLCSSVLPSFNRFVLADFVIYPVYASLYGRLPRWAKLVVTPIVVVAFLVTSWMMIERFTRFPFPRFVG